MSDGCVNLRYWNNQKSVAEISYIDSQFLLRPNTTNLKNALVESLEGLEERKFCQLAMDGSSTNWNVLEKFDKHLVEKGRKKSINIGCCSLHIIHGAFQTGATKTDWQINKVMKAMFKIFNESPARWDVYLREGTSVQFSMKFCEACWIEDGEVASQALETWDSVVATVKFWVDLCKSKQPRNNKSFDTLVSHH